MSSIVTEFINIDAFTGQPAECNHHLIFGHGMRSKADEDGLILPLTHFHHNMSDMGVKWQIHDNPAAEKLSKMLGQAIWEKEYYRGQIIDKPLWEAGSDPARLEFLKRYGEAYL